MFYATNNYLPVWGHESNVANDYGKVVIRQDGGCTLISDTGPSYDFQIPCKAHDYCYDLRKASFSGTVSDRACDTTFNQLMNAHCNDRAIGHRKACAAARVGAYLAVITPPVVTNPNPGAVMFSNVASRKCIDVEGPSATRWTPLQQWSCKRVNNQRFKIWPSSGAPGLFEIRPLFPNNRCISTLLAVWINPCNSSLKTQQVIIKGFSNRDEYTITSRANLQGCWGVPRTTTNGVDLISSVCGSQLSWFRWRIVNAM